MVPQVDQIVIAGKATLPPYTVIILNLLLYLWYRRYVPVLPSYRFNLLDGRCCARHIPFIGKLFARACSFQRSFQPPAAVGLSSEENDVDMGAVSVR
jgi:hypothetical protein